MGFMFCSFTTIMEINKDFLGKLFEQATMNPRLRQGFDLRTSSADNSQPMLNALLPGTVVPIHRHEDTTETVVCLCGKLYEVIYEEVVTYEKDASEALPNGFGKIVLLGPKQEALLAIEEKFKNAFDEYFMQIWNESIDCGEELQELLIRLIDSLQSRIKA